MWVSWEGIVFQGGSGGVVAVVSLWGGLCGVCCGVLGSDHRVVLLSLWGYEDGLNACHARWGVCDMCNFPG